MQMLIGRRLLQGVRRGQQVSHRSLSAMAASTSVSSFTQAAVAAMRKLYPESLADSSFDNTGLLLESPIARERKHPLKNQAMLAVDLTAAVADEAIRERVSIVIAYRMYSFVRVRILASPRVLLGSCGILRTV